MTQHELEAKIKRIEAKVDDIHAMLMTAGISREDFSWPMFENVLEEFKAGNTKPLDQYVKRGGKIPSAEEQQRHYGVEPDKPWPRK